MTVNPITLLILIPATATTGRAQIGQAFEEQATGPPDMSTCTVGFRIDWGARQPQSWSNEAPGTLPRLRGRS